MSKESHISWLTKWSEELGSAIKYYSMPESTQKAIINMDPQKGEKLCEWLNEYPKITELSISKFVERLLDVVTDSKDSQLAITHCTFFALFLCK
jgi:hypothetical protein